MLNHISLMGRLTADPELRSTAQGKSVCNFTLACDRDYGDGETDFIPIVAWGKTAEFASKFFRKGRLMVVSGRLQIRSWTDKNDSKRTTPEIVADHCYFGGHKKDEAEDIAPELTPVDDDEELPFI